MKIRGKVSRQAKGNAFLMGTLFLLLLFPVLTFAYNQARNHFASGDPKYSGSVNTRIYISQITPDPYTQAQGSSFTVNGYVTVANISNQPNWDPWPGVSVALIMNNSHVWENASADSIVNQTTDSSGNFSLVYEIPYNHSVGDWNLSVGLSPITGYNYTYNPSATPVFDVNITANVNVQVLGTTPDAIWLNEPFTVHGNLATEGGDPVQGVTVDASFGGTYNFTSSPTNATGGFSLSVPPLNASYSLDLTFTGSGYYNGASNSGISLLFVDDAFHVFSGQVLTITQINPRPVGSFIEIRGQFTYNITEVGGGDGYVKDQQVALYWITNDSQEQFIGITNTTSTGTYSHPYIVNASQYIDEVLFYSFNVPTQVKLKVVLLTLPGIEFNRTLWIRPSMNMTLHPSMDYAIFRNEPMWVEGNISPAISGLDIAVDLYYSNGTVFRYNDSHHDSFLLGDMETLPNGRFLFQVDGGRISGDLDNATIIVNPNYELGYSSVFASTDIIFINTVLFTNLNVGNSSSVTENSDLVIQGYARSLFGTPIREKPVYLNYLLPSGSFQAMTITGVDGFFSFLVPINVTAGQNISLFIFMNTTTGVTYLSPNYQIQVVEAPNYSNLLWWFIPIIAGLIAMGFIYVKLQKKQEIQKTRSLLQQKLDIVRELMNAGKIQEAIAYLFHLLKKIAIRQYDIEEPIEGETVREFLMMLMTEKGVEPELCFEFMNMVMEGLYSHHQINDEAHVSETVKLFGELYRAMTNDYSELIEL
ncbi:hypothetical protein GF325_15800 [Candidatus Bathyarchaeota archaeon]|nr:hypothetical protein [Candidatus Bathyarchaeota archaeon]